MIRIAPLFLFPLVAVAQPNLRPQGVIPPPVLPLAGSPTPAANLQPPPRHRPLTVHPNSILSGYYPIWPGYYEPPAIFNTYIVPPAATAVAPVIAPKAALRARLTLNVPTGAKVFLAGKEVDAAASPVVLESPVLEAGQVYSFDYRVTWPEGKATEERRRIVTVDAGDRKGVTYLSAK